MKQQVKRVGFTGTREGMTPKQRAGVVEAIDAETERSDLAWLHHGDCLGADAQAHSIAQRMGVRIAMHPPIENEMRAFCRLTNRDVLFAARPYLERNHDIVDQVEVLIAAPLTATETARSGTWATVRYARRRGKRLIVVAPDGRVL